jgi:hypothetical protein
MKKVSEVSESTIMTKFLKPTHDIERMEVNPAEGEEPEEGLQDGLADPHHAGGEG